MPSDSDQNPIDDSPISVWASHLGWLVLLIALGLIVITAGRLFRFTSPIADEMMLAGTVRTVGVGPYLSDFYMHWSGRWSGVGIFVVLGRYLNLQTAYGWILAVIQLTLPLSIYALLSAAFGAQLTRRMRAILSIGLVALHWAGEPSLKDSYYWITGAIENHLSLSLAFLVVAGLIHIRNRKPSPWVILGLAALAMVATGMHQLYGMYLCTALLFGTVLAYRANNPGWRAWAIVAGVAIIGTAICTFAPGNAFRLDAEKPPRGFEFFQTLARWWATTVFGTWMLDLKLWLATLVLVCHPRAAHVVPMWLRERRLRVAMIAVAAMVGVIVVALFANWWTFPRPLPGRTQSAIYLLFMIGWFTTAFALAAVTELQATRPVWAGLTVCFSLALLSGGSFPVANSDLASGRAAAFRWCVNYRDRLLRDAVAAGDRNPRVPSIGVVPDCLLFAEVVDESVVGPCWYNVAYCKYYGLDSIGPKPIAQVAGAK